VLVLVLECELEWVLVLELLELVLVLECELEWELG
jgi:hypothetical protein